VPADDPLDRFRAELLKEEEAGGTDGPARSDDDDIAARALAHLQTEDLHPLTHLLISAVLGDDATEPSMERGAQRIKRAVAALHEQQHPAPSGMLKEARESARMSLRDAAEVLGITEAAIDRIERGRGTRSLLNLPAPTVAEYVRHVGIDPRRLLAALRAIPTAEAVYGHTPGVSAEERSELLRKAADDARREDRKWAVDFLTWAERSR